MDRLHPPRGRGRRIGIIKPDGSGEKALTSGPGDEGPSWAASSRELIFQRGERPAAPASIALRSTAANRAQSPSPGRVRSRLVGSDGLMRQALLPCCLPSRWPLPLRQQRRLPVIIPFGRSQPAPLPQLTGIDALRADFLAHSGRHTVYFGSDSAILGAPARPTLQAQALWLRQHPEVVVRIEGHADRATRATMRWRSARAVPKKSAIIWCYWACRRRSSVP